MAVSVGSKAERRLEITAEMVKAYAAITGDFNPLHFDAEFTAKTRFGRLIAHGGLTTGILHALIAMDLPGPGSVFMSQSWSFPRPVFIGDAIIAEGTVKSAREGRGIYVMEFVVRNQAGEAVLTGEAAVYRAAAVD
jgi:acyl dehydratase